MKGKLVAVIISAFAFSSCYMVRAYKYRNLELSDVHSMPSVTIEKGDSARSFINKSRQQLYDEMGRRLDSMLSDTYTAAFVIIRNDTMIYESYFNGFDQSSLLPSFSVAKSIVGTLIGIAIHDGAMSPADPVTKYLPSLSRNDARFEKITIQNLLDMRSGIDFNEGSYDLKDDAIKLGFRPNIQKQVKKLKVKKAPGGELNYQSINTLLLAMALEKATGKSVHTYLSEKIWKPAGMEFDASWTVDSKKHQQEIAYAGVNAAARDYAKFGSLYLNDGKANGKQIIPSEWIKATVDADTMRKYDGYKNQLWGVSRYINFSDSLKARAYVNMHKNTGGVRSYTNKEGKKAFYVPYQSSEFYAQGILGEFVYVHPEKNLVIVRLGHFWKHKTISDPLSFIKLLADEM